MNQLELIVCDLETTGFQPESDKIIEVAMLRVVNGEITEQFTTLVNPACAIPLRIKRLTGIEGSQLDSAPLLEQVRPALEKFMAQVPLVGHNVGFDRSFLEAHLGPLPFTTCLDTLELARVLFPAAPGHSLSALAGYLGLPTREQHRALEDALTTYELYTALTQKLVNLPLEILLQLFPLLRQGQSPWVPVLEALTRHKVRDFSAGKIYSRVPLKEPPGIPKTTRKGEPELSSGDLLTVEHLLGPNSPLAELLPGYEHRREQINMAAAVESTLAEQKILLVEAGTGTGKSLAYMLPALLWAVRHNQRALVATNTINLQEQLWRKDIPMLQQLLPVPFQAALLKGRSNYLCLRRFLHVSESIPALNPAEALLVARVLVWLQETDSGDRSELNLFGPDNDTWLQFCSDSDSCFGGACRWQNKYCFVARARRSAENARLVIVNHALLFTDMASETKILPPHGTLIIDEAHHIEDTATRHLGRQVARSDMNRWLSQAARTLRKLKEMPPPRDGQKWLGAMKEAEKSRQELKESAETFFHCLAGNCIDRADQRFNQTRHRLHRQPDPALAVQAEWQNLLYRLRDFLTGGLKTMIEIMEGWTAAGEPWEDKLQDIYTVSGQGNGYLADLLFIMEEPADNYVCWVETYSPPGGQGSPNCTLHATPIDVSDLLYEHLFSAPRTTVLTSATLTVNGKFDHFMSCCGLDRVPGERICSGIMESPFDYEKQCLLCISDSLPLPGDTGTGEYLDSLVETVYSLAMETGGRTLVLFTSHKLLRDVYHRARPMFEEAGICLLGHGLDGGRSRLVENFVRDGRSVLFGTSSFWEGVDIPGDSLVNVIIVKLPFAPPDDPVQEARQEMITSRGRSAFYNLSLPQAVIRFKQGFGRLIRSRRDRGVVVVLDRRLIEKRYGRVFLNSLPVKTHLRGDITLFRKKLAEWIR